MFVREGGNSYWKYLRISAIGVVLLLAASVGLKPLLEQVRRFADETASEVDLVDSGARGLVQQFRKLTR